jgi:orotidine 5'-phosphate decarboxylase subfamily 2
MNFKEKLSRVVNKNNSLLCVGLDIDKEKMPGFLFKNSKNPFFEFNKSIIDETKGLVCAYKLNMAFYEVLGKNGLDVLEKTIEYIPREIVIILDGKRNDIGNTASKYAKSLFETYKADAVTINPYLGFDGVKPFLDYKDKCSFILCRTSNPSAVDFQDLKTQGKPFYEVVAEKIKIWNKNNNCGAVVGATYPEELKKIRSILGDDIPLLLPGIGKQGGDVEKTVKYGVNHNGEMAIINSSRGIIFYDNSSKYSEKARDKAMSLRDQINDYR